MLGYESSDKETACESNSRRTGGHRRCNSNTDAADPDCDAATVSREAVAEFAAAIRRTGHWNFEGGDLVPELLTALPSWRHSGLILEILEDGHNPVVLGGNDRGTIVTQIIRVRRINDSHYRAVVDGMDVDLGANGDCFFYSVWYALETSVPEEERRRIYHSNLPSGRVEAAAFLRNAIADYSVAHGDEVGDFLTHTQPKPTSGIKSDGSETHATETSADNSARSSGWSETVPFALREIGRSLFHSAKSLSSTLGWTLLLGQGVRTIFEWLPLNYWPFQFYFLCDALINRREYLGAFLSLLALIPYNTLSSDNFLFSVADASRQIYQPLLSGMDDLPPFFWAALGALALVTNYALLERQNVDPPQTRIGQVAAACLHKLRHVPQLYGLLETIHSVAPLPALDESGRVKMTTAEIRDIRGKRKALKAEFLSGVARSRRPATRSGDVPTASEFARPSSGDLMQASPRGRHSSIANEPALPLRTTTDLAANSTAEPLALVALDAIFKVAERSAPISPREGLNSPLPLAEKCLPARPVDSITSAAPETRSFITLPVATATAIAASGAGIISLPQIVIGAVTIITISAIAAYIVHLKLNSLGESDDTNIDILLADALPLSQEYHDENADLHTKNRKWLYLTGKNLAGVQYFIDHQFDHLFFQDAINLIHTPGDENRVVGSGRAIYEVAVREAVNDFAEDYQIPLHQLSSEDRYGAAFYQIIEKNGPGKDFYNREDFKSILIKIKLYETLIIRKLDGEFLYGTEGAIAKLETVFGLPIKISEYFYSEKTMDDYIARETGYDSTPIRVFGPGVENGTKISISLWTETIQKYLNKNSSIPESAISECRDIISRNIKETREQLYILKNTHDDSYEKNKTRLVDYRYASIHLEMLIKISTNYLEILNNLKSQPHEFRSKIQTFSSIPRDAFPLKARILAVKAALKMFGKNELNSLSEIDYLKNYPLIIGSSPEMSAFISLAEAIFFEALCRMDTENLHRFATNPTILINFFRKALDESPPKNLKEYAAVEGMRFAQNIANNYELASDTAYYQQFSYFRLNYQKPLSKNLAYLALVENGMHLYSLLSEVPTEVVQMTFYMRGKLPAPQKPSIGYGYLLFLNWISDQTSEKLTYAKAGELIFCKLSAGNWVVISTLAGSCVVRTLSTEQINQCAALKDIIQKKSAPRRISGPLFLDALDPMPRGSSSWWIDQALVKNVIRPIFGNATGIDETSFEKAYLTLTGNYPRDFKNKNILTIANDATDDMLTTSMDQAKEGKYKRKWWQYITAYIDFADMIYRSTQDPDYKPSAGEITMEVLSGTLTPCNRCSGGSADVDGHQDSASLSI